jgi:hypothetical protein
VVGMHDEGELAPKTAECLTREVICTVEFDLPWITRPAFIHECLLSACP